MMSHFLRIILLTFSCFAANAQLTYDRADFERINQAYAKMTALQTAIGYVYYDSHTSTAPGQTLEAVLSLSGPDFHYRLGDMETLAIEAITLLVDHEEKEIMLDRGRKNLNEIMFGANLDTILSLCQRIQFSYPAPGIKKYEMYVELPETERIDLYFDTTTFLMQRVVLFYKTPLGAQDGGTGEKPRLELVYRRQDTRPKFAKDLFSPERFVQKSGSRYVATTAFRDYEIMDYTSK